MSNANSQRVKLKRENRRQPGNARLKREKETAEFVDGFLRWLAPHSKAVKKAMRKT